MARSIKSPTMPGKSGAFPHGVPTNQKGPKGKTKASVKRAVKKGKGGGGKSG